LEVLPAGHGLLDGGVLARQPNDLADTGRLADGVEAADGERTGVGTHQRGDRPHERRLAGAVRAEQRGHAPRPHLEVETAEGLLPPEALDQAVGLDDRGHGRLLSSFVLSSSRRSHYYSTV